jgi:hypothetical protein
LSFEFKQISSHIVPLAYDEHHNATSGLAGGNEAGRLICVLTWPGGGRCACADRRVSCRRAPRAYTRAAHFVSYDARRGGAGVCAAAHTGSARHTTLASLESHADFLLRGGTSQRDPPLPLQKARTRLSSRLVSSRRARVRCSTDRRRCCESRRRLKAKAFSLCLIQLNDDRRCRLVLCGRSHRLYVELLAPHVRGIFVRA